MIFRKLYRWLRLNFFYLGRPPWDTGVSPPELVTFLKTADPGRALDIGCGTGTNLLTIAQQGWQVVGVDIAFLSVLEARKKLREAGVDGRVIHGTITSNLGLAAAFDLVLDIGCYHSLTQLERIDYRKNLQKWLKSGGTFLLYAHQRTSPGASHGVSEDDFQSFSTFLDLQWRVDNDEIRPNGGDGFPATWVRYSCEK